MTDKEKVSHKTSIRLKNRPSCHIESDHSPASRVDRILCTYQNEYLLEHIRSFNKDIPLETLKPGLKPSCLIYYGTSLGIRMNYIDSDLPNSSTVMGTCLQNYVYVSCKPLLAIWTFNFSDCLVKSTFQLKVIAIYFLTWHVLSRDFNGNSHQKCPL